MKADSSQTEPPASNQPPVSQIVGARGLLASTSVVSGMTLISRVLGLVRDVVFARLFGASLVMDAFLVANRIPNMLRRFFAEGAFSQGFVPVMARYREGDSKHDAVEFVDAVAGTFGLVLFVVTLVGVIAAPVLVAIVAPGFVGDDGRFDIATLMLRFTFPYLLFVSLTAFAGGILNTYGRFAVPAFTPVLLNVSLIGCAIFLAPQLDEPAMALAYGVLIAGIVQLLFQLPFLRAIGFLPRPRWAPMHAGVRRAGKLMLPAIFGSSVAQINVLLGGILASMLGVGKISLLYYSDRLMEFPLGLFGIALATVTLPYLSRQAASDSLDKFSATIDWSMRLVVLIAVPSAFGLILLADPLVIAIFYGGEFSSTDVRLTAIALQAFAFGLIGFSFVKILAPAYFAREDTRTPVKIGLVSLGVNFVLSVILAFSLVQIEHPAPHAGLALAISVAALLNAYLLYRGLRQRNLLRPAPGWTGFMLRVAVAIVGMAASLSYLSRSIDWWLAATILERSGWLLVSVVAAALTYFLILLLLGMRPSDLRLRDH